MSSTRSSTSVPLAFLLICASLLHVSFGIVIEKGPTAPEIISHKEFRDALSKVKMGYKVVGDFHTHPFPHVYQFPGKDDIARAYKRGVPAVVLSCTGIIYYGPDHRPNLLLNPSGYPGGNEKYTNQKYHIYGPNPFPCYK
eukprot:Gb_32276 [translate_table: standard]